MSFPCYFRGTVLLDRSLLAHEQAYLEAFAATRHVQCREELLVPLADPLREAVGLPVGPEGAYAVSAPPVSDAIVDQNQPPAGQPGLWCDWVPTVDGTALVCKEGDTGVANVEWIGYLIAHFFQPWGYTVNGRVLWHTDEWPEWEEDGESYHLYLEEGQISVRDNRVEIQRKTVPAEQDHNA
jgi:hypothetical protein